MGPIDYTTQVQSPFQAALQGFQAGAGIKDVLDQRALAEQQRLQQEQARLQMQQDLAKLTSNPNVSASDYAAMVLRYPQLKDQFKQSWEALNESQRQNKLDQGTRAYAAIQSGRPEIAEQLFRDRAAAARNSGAEEDAKQAETMAELIKVSPGTALTTVGLNIASYLGPDKFAETFGKLGAEQRAAEQAPGALRKVNADATKAEADAMTSGVTAKFAEQQAVLDLQKKGWDIKAIQEDIGFKREANRIAAMRASFERESNALKREELGIKLQEARSALDAKVRERVATAESGAASIDNMLNTIERIKGNKSLDSVLGSIEGLPYYPNAALGTANPFGNGDERADAIALIETLGSQAFLAQIPNIKGMGALSNTEGDKLQAAFQNLKRSQSEKQFRENLDEAARLLKKGREGLSRSTGVPLAKPDTPAAPGSRPPLDSFEKPGGQ